MKCVVNFASGHKSQTELRLYFGVCVLQKFQQSSHRDGRFACGGYSLRAGAFLFSIEAFLELLPQLYTGGLLDMSICVAPEYPKVGTLVFFALCLNIRKILQERRKSGRTATEKEKSPYWLQGCNSKGGEVTVY